MEQKNVVSSVVGWGLSTGENHNQPQNIPVCAPSSHPVWDLCGFEKMRPELEEGRASRYGHAQAPSVLALHSADQALLGKSGGRGEII